MKYTDLLKTCSNCSNWEGRFAIRVEDFSKEEAMCYLKEKLSLPHDTCEDFSLYLDQLGFDASTSDDIAQDVYNQRIKPLIDSVTNSTKYREFKEKQLYLKLVNSKTPEELKLNLENYIMNNPSLMEAVREYSSEISRFKENPEEENTNSQ